MTSLTREDLVRPFTPKIEAVPAPELQADGVIHVRSFSAADRGKLEVMSTRAQSSKNYDELPKIKFLSCALSICDEHGTLLFKETELDAISQLPAIVVDRISEKALELNGLDKNKIKELEKNSRSAQAGASLSD